MTSKRKRTAPAVRSAKMDEADQAFQREVRCLLCMPAFIDWLKGKGYEQSPITRQMVEEYDNFQQERCDRANAQPAPPPIVEHVDPARMDADEWVAGVDEWIREGGDPATVPTERSEWDARMRRRIARLKEDQIRLAKARREDLRQRLINSMAPPEEPDVTTLNGKNILDAQKAYEKEGGELAEAWNARFQLLAPAVKDAWKHYHEFDDNFVTMVYLRPCEPTESEFFPIDPIAIQKGVDHPDYRKFQKYNAATLQQLERLEANLDQMLSPTPGSRSLLKAWSLDEIDENVGSTWPVPGVIPRGVTFVYGLPKSGKSLWMQKLSVCIAGDVPFDGIEGLEHGRVLYLTRDIGASRQEVKKRLMTISSRLAVPESTLNGKLMLTDDPFHLDDPTSVDDLLLQNPGPFTLVVIDPLFRCVSGSLTQDAIASAIARGFSKISRATGAGVVAIHHEPRGSEQLFGSIMLDATHDSKVHVERGKDRNSVIVTVQELKNASISNEPFAYRMEGEFLAPVVGGDVSPAKTEAITSPSRHQEILARFPTGWFSRKAGRKLVEDLLTGRPEARRKQWQRAIAAMEAAGDIEVKKNSMRKM